MKLEIVAKFYDKYFGGSIIHQEIINREIITDDDITSYSVTDFTMPIIPGIQEDVKVQIFESTGNTDKMIFSGFVYKVVPIWGQFELISIQARGEKALMYKRRTLTTYNWSTQDISVIVGTLLDKYNNDYNEQRTYYCDFAQNINLGNIKVNDEYYGIFDEIAEQTQSYRNIQDGHVTFSKTPGNDLTATQFAEFNPLSPNPGNIQNISLEGTATGGNVVIVEQVDGSIQIDDSQFAGELTGVVTKTVREGDLSTKASQFAEQMSRPQRRYQINVSNNSIQANVGDTISVDVTNTNSFYDFTGDALVITKQTTYRNATKIISYGISEFIVSPFNLTNRQNGVEKYIKLLKIK